MVHWPGDPVPNFYRISEMENGAVCNVTVCSMPAHTGTHIDAPRHFLHSGVGIDAFPPEVGIGRARVIQIADDKAVITRREVEDREISRGDRILFKTRNSGKRWSDLEFQRDYVALDDSSARFLAEVGVILVGVDYLSVGRFEGDGPETHRTLLGAGIWVAEGLDLSNVPPGDYDLVCLPLKIVGSDGAPARAMIRHVYSITKMS